MIASWIRVFLSRVPEENFSFSGSDWTISCSGLEIVGLGVAEMVNLVLVSSVSWTSSWSRAGWLGRCSARWWTSWTVRRISRARAVNWVSLGVPGAEVLDGREAVGVVRRLTCRGFARVTRPSRSCSDSSRRSSAAAAAISLQWVSMSWRSARTVAREILNDSAISLWELPCRLRKWTRTARRRCLGVICMAGFLCVIGTCVLITVTNGCSVPHEPEPPRKQARDAVDRNAEGDEGDDRRDEPVRPQRVRSDLRRDEHPKAERGQPLIAIDERAHDDRDRPEQRDEDQGEKHEHRQHLTTSGDGTRNVTRGSIGTRY